MNIRITPHNLNGSVEIISSKTYAHRLLIAAALADKPTKVYVNTVSEDVAATVQCINSLGAEASYDENDKCFTVKPVKNVPVSATLNAGESGSTARFLLPVAAALSDSVALNGSGRLPERPFEALVREMRKNGVKVSSDYIPIKTSGRLTSGTFELEGNVSSQYITGLLLALPLVGGGTIRLLSPLESKPYADITAEVLKDFGINVREVQDGYIVPGTEYISPSVIRAEGDWSNAAFWIAANEICGNVRVCGLKYDSIQGDRKITELLKEDEIDAGNIPDLVPVLSVLALSKKGVTVIRNAGRLRLKESDRLNAVETSLNAFGGDVRVDGDSLIINGKGRIKGGRASGFSDHRIIMSLAIASLLAEGDCIIEGAESVKKSYPGFFDEFNRLGGKAYVI